MKITLKSILTGITTLMKMPQKDTQSTSPSGHETHNNNYGNNHTTNEQIEDTPFRLVGNKEDGYCITMGNYKLTQPTMTKEAAVKKLQKEQWSLTATMIVTMPMIMAKHAEELQTQQQ
jgi:hypothetical protein